MKKITHLDKENKPQMVDVSSKKITTRFAHAQTKIIFPSLISERFINGDINTAKGPVFSTAIIAGVMAAKKTHELIPFCHPIGLDDCDIKIEFNTKKEVIIDCICKVKHRTGVEMEAMTGSSVAALTIYDMCKALSHNIIIQETKLISKSGGKKDFHREK
tara:strand:- start:1967 stop:2446 length:480 start_codon:yes stop_codon:yes gene_type:complete